MLMMALTVDHDMPETFARISTPSAEFHHHGLGHGDRHIGQRRDRWRARDYRSRPSPGRRPHVGSNEVARMNEAKYGAHPHLMTRMSLRSSGLRLDPCFHFSTTSGSTCLMEFRTRATLARQSPSSLILALIS
jgi:hypothetical protein